MQQVICEELNPSQAAELYRADNEMRMNGSTVTLFRRQLLEWYWKNRRELPWRGNYSFPSDFEYTFPNAYGTWISEVMLQQTRVDTVIPYWMKWIKRFPSVDALAIASSEEVNTLWAGLGYYRRAQMLLKGAQTVMRDYGGIIPDNVDNLKKIDGIGPYTAGAVASIAFNKAVPIVDGNVIRVFSRLLASNHVVGSKEMDKLCWSVAEQVVDPCHSGDFNQALMDLGATVCKPTSPSCEICPVANICIAKKIIDSLPASAATQQRLSGAKRQKVSGKSKVVEDIEEVDGLPTSVCYFPQKAAKKKPEELSFRVKIFSVELEGTTHLLLVKRKDTGLLANQWEFPCNELIDLNEPEEMFASCLREFGIVWLTNQHDSPNIDFAQFSSVLISTDIDPIKLDPPIVHIFSHQHHTMHITHHRVDITFDRTVKQFDALSEALPLDGTGTTSGKFREYKWFQVNKLLDTGITTGCKKILKRYLDQSKDKLN